MQFTNIVNIHNMEVIVYYQEVYKGQKNDAYFPQPSITVWQVQEHAPINVFSPLLLPAYWENVTAINFACILHETNKGRSQCLNSNSDTGMSELWQIS